MHDSITIAEVGSMVKVSGSRMATPLGPPRPGSTPTKMPSTSPTIIKASVFQVRRTVKPWRRRPNASILVLQLAHDLVRKPVPTFRDHALITKQGFERALGHDHVEGDLKGDEHGDGEQEGGDE